MTALSNEQSIDSLQARIVRDLLPCLKISSGTEGNPVHVSHVPLPWYVIGKGNYAVVVEHPAFVGLVVKVYVGDVEGCREEVAVYQTLGKHRAYSECYGSGERFLILKKISGHTLYDCVVKGIRVERQVFVDVEEALDFARLRGLYPHDVHGKNLMMFEGRGYVVDVSDFYKREECTMWWDLKKAYERIYLNTIYKFTLPVPAWMMNLVRKGYRIYRRRFRRQMAKN